MQLTTENTKEFIEFWNNNKPEKFVHPMHEGIATVILDYLDQAEYQLTLEDNKVTIFDQQTNEELGEYTPEELFWKARLLIESNDKDSRSSTNHYNNLLDIFSNKELSPKEYKEQIRDELQNYYLTNECFNKNDELKWNSINYTTKNWIEIENIYYEYEETRGFLSIGDSLTDLEEEYGENNFPEKAVEDGKLKIFDVYANDVEDYLREKSNLKDSEEINEILGDYEYKTEDLLKYYIPNLSNENAELLSVIIDTQYIYLDHLPSITFENIYNKIDKSKLNEVQLEELNKIKEELSKPTVEIFKQSFDSFIMSLSEAASKSIQRDIEKLNAKAFYVFNVDNNEYTIVSKRDGENPFMVHKYYPENETGGIHHGSYDIDTYENAEKIAANRLIDEHKEKYKLINFIAATREDIFNLELKNKLSSVFEYLNKYSLTEENKIELIDVKAYQYEGPSGKLKVLVEYKGNCREDDLFNLLHDDEENGQDGHDYEINGYKLDLNPIKAEKSGTISEYLAMLKNKEQYLQEKNESIQEKVSNEPLTFGQFNSETNEIKLIKEAYFKELVIDENDASKKKVVLGFKENDQEQLLEMGEVEYKNLLNAFGFSKEQQENTLEINKYKTFAEEKPEVVFDMIKSDYLGGTPFSDNELIGYLKGLKKSNNYHHYLDELLFESLKQSDESLFSNVVDAGADLTWRREENGEPINILHYAAADNLDIAIKKIIGKTKSLVVDDYINLFSEENFEGHTPLEIAISNSDGQYFESTKLLIDAMNDEGFSGVEDLLIEDKLGNKVLYTSWDNLDCASISCFDGNNNIISVDTESLVDEKSFGEIVSQDLIYQTNNDFFKGNIIELNRSSKLISELKKVPQKLWDDEINIKLLKTLPEAGFFNSKKDLYDFDSILALEKIKKSLFSDFDNQKESLLQGLYTKKEFVDSIKEKELNLEELNNCEIGEFVECLENKYFRTELAALCFDKKINELFDTISPRPNEMGMYKNNDYTCLSLKISAASKNRPITEGEAEIILKYIQYENFNFYESMNNELCMLDVSEDFTGEGEIMTPEKIIDMAYRMMVKARNEEYSIYDVTDEKVLNDLQERFGLIEEQKIKPSKDEKTSIVEQFFSKLKDSLYDNAKLEDVLKSAATVLQTFSDTEKKEISQYLHNKGASSGDRVGKVLSSILEINEQKQTKKRSKTDDDTRGR